MPEVVNVHLGPNRFTQGFYRMDGDRLVMTFSDGSDVEPVVSHTMRPGDNPRTIAAVLTKEIRARMHSPFNDPIDWPEASWL